MPSSSTGILAQYGALLNITTPGALALALGARAPYAMIPLGVLTGVTASTGSIASGGAATGVVSIAGAVGGPLIGRWADSAGQRRVLLTIAPLNLLAMAAMLLALAQSWNGPLLWAVCLWLGASTVPVGSFTRARWIERTDDPRTLSTAFSYESTVDEITFVLGPALVGIAASAAFPSAPMMLAAALVLLAGIPFALTAPRALGTAATESAGPAPRIGRVILAILPALITMICIGTVFGSLQTGTTERAAELGSPGLAGLIYAVGGIGSAVTALLAVLIPERVALAARLLLGGLGIGAGALAVALAVQGSLPATAAILLVIGLFIGPTMVTAFTLAERRTQRGGTAVAMTTMGSAVTVGVSIGATAGGYLAGSSGSAAAYLVAMGAAVVIALTGGLLLARGRSARTL